MPGPRGILPWAQVFFSPLDLLSQPLCSLRSSSNQRHELNQSQVFLSYLAIRFAQSQEMLLFPDRNRQHQPAAFDKLVK